MKKLFGVVECLEEQQQSNDNPPDVLCINIPLFIRLIEFAREDSSGDVDLHLVTERMIEVCRGGKIATMVDYNQVTDGIGKKED